MKSAIINSYGSTQMLEISEMPRPLLQADEVLVNVHSAGINPKDIFIRKGRFRWVTGKRFPMLTGFDFAGKVVEAGALVKKIRVNDEIYGMLDGWKGGACAEYIVVNPKRLARKPEALSFEETAALPLVSLTALQALRDKAGIQAGQHVCINGASGGVGSVAVQIAKIYGACVTAISHERNHDFLYELGADNCIDYRHTDIIQSGQRFDIFFDVFGNQRFKAVKPILKDKGVWVSTVVQPHVLISVAMTGFLSRKKAKLVVVKSDSGDLDKIRDWVETRQLKPVIYKIYPLDKIRDAHAQLETKHTRGKVIIHI